MVVPCQQAKAAYQGGIQDDWLLYRNRLSRRELATEKSGWETIPIIHARDDGGLEALIVEVGNGET